MESLRLLLLHLSLSFPLMISLENVVLFPGDLQFLAFAGYSSVIFQSIDKLMSSLFHMSLPQYTLLLDLSLSPKVQVFHLFYCHITVFANPILGLHFLFRHKYNINHVDEHFDIELALEPGPVEDKQILLMWQRKDARRLKLKGEEYEATITLNQQNKSLEIVSKHLQQKQEFWGSFTIKDLELSVQTLLETITGLYEYICENSEQVQIEREKVIIRLNFLKQTRDIELKLHPMLMFSLDEHQKLSKQIQHLEQEVRTLKAKQQGCRKLTIRLTENTVNFNHYAFLDLFEARPYDRLNQLSMLRICPENTLPQSGIWAFTLNPVCFHGQQGVIDKTALKQKGKMYPYLEIGIINDTGERDVLKMLAFQSQIAQQEAQDGFIKENGLLKIVINLDDRKIAVQRFFEKGIRMLEWTHFKKVERLWLTLVAYRMNIQTDLFVEEQCVYWDKSPLPVERQDDL